MKARVHIMLKSGVLDPQGQAVRHALGTLGFDGVENVRQGKVIELKLAAGRMRDQADIVELVRQNQDQIDVIRAHLQGVHEKYASASTQ